MTATTFLFGLSFLSFLLIMLATKLGRTIVSMALLGGVWLALHYYIAHRVAPPPVQPGELSRVGDLIALAFAALMFGSGFVQLKAYGKRVMRERRERAKRLWALEHPLDGEILPPQRYLSP